MSDTPTPGPLDRLESAKPARDEPLDYYTRYPRPRSAGVTLLHGLGGFVGSLVCLGIGYLLFPSMGVIPGLTMLAAALIYLFTLTARQMKSPIIGFLIGLGCTGLVLVGLCFYSLSNMR